MEGKKLNCVYFPEVDRFVVGREDKSIGIKTLLQSKWYSSLEYFRYIPDSEVSFEAIDNFLEKYPQELCCEITDECNFSCPICVADSSDEKRTQMGRKIYTRVIKDKPGTVKRISLTGGEPTLHPYLPVILAEASGAVSSVVLSTNGSFPEKLEIALKKTSNVVVAISLHGLKAEHDGFVQWKDAYERALESIQVAASYAEAIQIHTTIVPQTLKVLPKLCEKLTEMPIKEHRLNMIKPRGRRLVSGVTYEVLIELLDNLEVPYKISVKKRDQTFLFVGCEGKKEIRNVRRC